MAADLPAPVLADLLGLHIVTGVRWAKYAKRDWETYLADRRTTTSSTTGDSPLARRAERES